MNLLPSFALLTSAMMTIDNARDLMAITVTVITIMSLALISDRVLHKQL